MGSRSFHPTVESSYNSWTTEIVGLFPTPSHRFTVASMRFHGSRPLLYY